MFKNYFKTALRQLTRNRLFSTLNILGLATGLCGSIFIFLWVRDELSFDRQSPQPEDVFRVNDDMGGQYAATVPYALSPFLQRTLPVVKQSVRFLASDPMLMSYGEKRFIEKKIWFADSNFQQLFSWPLVKGSIFRTNDQVLITESAAKRYFKDEDPIGKRLRYGNQVDFIVAGVLKDLPANSSIQFDFMMPFAWWQQDQEKQHYDPWNNFIYYTYIRLDHQVAGNPAALAALERTFDAIYKKNGTPNINPGFRLERLTDIHLGEHLLMDLPGGGSLQYVRIFSLVAVFILLIACINFMNLSTALSSRRAKEVGLRKTVGASRGQLTLQFLGEAVLLALFALGLGIALVALLMPLFNELTGKSFSIAMLDGSRILLLLGIGILSGLVSGSYPALVLSGFKPAKVLKNTRLFQPGKAYFRNGLVVLQFTIAITLMVGTVVVYRQLRFIRDRNMGFNKSNLLYVPLPESEHPEDMQRGADRILAGLANHPGILAQTAASDLPTYLTSGDGDVTWPGKDMSKQPLFPLMGMDEHTLDVFGMQLLKGRTFSKAYASDSNAMVVNETALRLMHMDPATAVGKTIRYSGSPFHVIGVVRDFNFKPVQFTVEPLLIMYHWWHGYEYVVVKTAPGATASVLEALKKQFSAVYPQFVFEYGFVDKDLDALYVSEAKMGDLFNVFCVLAIFISSLGLFGLSAYTTQRRFKEIGVRKVLGASVVGIVRLLALEFLIPVAVAALVAFPLAGWAMDTWLHGFAYRIGLEWWYFALAGSLALVVALGTVSYEALKAASSNPVRALRTE